MASDDDFFDWSPRPRRAVDVFYAELAGEALDEDEGEAGPNVPAGSPPARPPPPKCNNWVQATDADVARDKTRPRYMELLSQPLPYGYETPPEKFNGRWWK